MSDTATQPPGLAESDPKPPENLLKVRDDHRPVGFEAAGQAGKFKLCDGEEATWISQGPEFDIRELRNRIEPWLTSLFQSEHLSLLVGSGLTHAVHHLAAGKLATGMSDIVSVGPLKTQILDAAQVSAARAGRSNSNIEDQIRVANELVRGLEILGKAQEAAQLESELTGYLTQFAKSILASERGIATAAEGERGEAFTALVSFLMSFASRTGTRDRLNVFTTNYDRVIEAGAELAGLHLLDRFVGSLMPVFRSSRLDLDMHYNPPGIRGEPRYLEGVARFTKLHGSVDWVYAAGNIRRVGLPFGAEALRPYLKAPGVSQGAAYELMIYPNSAKDRQTSEFPYVELFRDLAVAVCRPNSTVVTYGYSFGDEHINRVIRDMLTIPSTHLVVISRDDRLGRILPLATERPSQITLLVGPLLGDLVALTEHFLPKPAIDRTTFRMNELLRHRYGGPPEPGDKADKAKPVPDPASELF